MEELVFDDLTPRSMWVRIGKKRYLLREASEGAVIQWRNAQLKATKVGSGGKLDSIEGIADAEPLLIALCLREEGPVEGQWERSVAPGIIRGWPARVVKPIFDWIVENSGLKEEEPTGPTTPEEIKAEIDKLSMRLESLNNAESDISNGRVSDDPLDGGTVLRASTHNTSTLQEPLARDCPS